MRRILLIPVFALMAVFFVAAPANAATVDSFTVNEGTADITANVGDELDLAWTVLATGDPSGAVTITAAGDAAGNPGVSGWDAGVLDGESATVTLVEEGTYQFAISASEDGVDGVATSETITVTVEAADGSVTEIPAPEITFPDQCSVVLPDNENVSYGAGFGQSGGGVESGELDLADFYNRGAETTFSVIPDEGFAFPDDAQTTFPVTVSQDCYPQLIDVEAVCQGVDFSNTTDGTLLVQYGNVENPEVDDEFEIAGGGSRTVSTDRDLVFFLTAEDDESEILQQGFVDVEQDCTPAAAGASHPTVAPAAGA